MRRRCSGIGGAVPIGGLVTRLWPAAIFISVAGVGKADAKYYDFNPHPPAVPAPRGYTSPIVRAFSGSSYKDQAGKWHDQMPNEWLGSTLVEIAAARRRVRTAQTYS